MSPFFRRMLISGLILSLVASVLGSGGQGLAAGRSEQSVYAVADDARTYGLFLSSPAGKRRIGTASVSAVTAYRVIAKLSPDGEHVAYIPDHDGRFGSRLVIVRSTDGQQVVQVDGFVKDMAWDPDGKRLAYTSWDRVNLTTEVLPGQEAPSQSPRPVGNLSVVNLEGTVTSIPSDQSIVRVLGFSTDDRLLYAIREEITVNTSREAFVLVDLRTGKVTDTITSPGNSRFYHGCHYRRFAAVAVGRRWQATPAARQRRSIILRKVLEQG